MTSDTDAATNGRGAASPWAIPAGGWKQVVLRAWKEAGTDNIGLVASGVAFCAILAMVPMLGAVVLTYGLAATPATVVANVRSLTEMMPADVAKLIGEQLAGIVSASDGKKGFALAVALGIALYGAMKGAAAIVTALNIAYDEEETRGFVRLNLLALGVTVGAVLAAIVAVVAITAMAALEALFPGAPEAVLAAAKILSYVVMAGAGAAAAATLYRFAPDRDAARWVWLTPGSLFASLAWMAMTLGFGVYVAEFGSYDATYGSLGAAVVLLTWLYLSAYVLLLGAELNCELERQTVRDTTRGPAGPMGSRNAYAADTVAGDGSAGASSPLSDQQGGGAVVDYAAGRVAGRLTGRDAGSVASILAVTGLSLLRRRKRAAGLGLLAAAAGLSWRHRKETSSCPS